MCSAHGDFNLYFSGDYEQLFIYLLAIWISTYVKCLLSLPFFYKNFFHNISKIKKFLFLNMLDVSILLLWDDLQRHYLNGVFQLTQSLNTFALDSVFLGSD